MITRSVRDAVSVRTEQVLKRFNRVFLTHDPSDLPDLVADDCIIENTAPAPDGSRHEGREACIALWTQIATMRGAHFEPESVVAHGDIGFIRWRLVWGSAVTELVRGVNLVQVRAGKIVAAQGYTLISDRVKK